MRPSAENHPLAILRRILNWTQKEAAKRLGVSPQTIQGIELGTRRLTEHNAQRITDRTGVSLDWLLSGNPKAMPLVEGEFNEFTKATHEKWLADLRRAKVAMTDGSYILDNAPGLAIALLMLLVKVGKSGERASLAVHKADEAVERLFAEFWPEVAEAGFDVRKALELGNWDSRTHGELSRAISAALKTHLSGRKERKGGPVFVKAQSKTKPSRSRGSQRRGNS
jgi:transcriptional regulator with XRE-family HTH domain